MKLLKLLTLQCSIVIQVVGFTIHSYHYRSAAAIRGMISKQSELGNGLLCSQVSRQHTVVPLRTSTQLRMSTAEEWLPSQVLSNNADGVGLRLIEVQVDNSVAAQYTDPGQYVKLKVGDSKPSFIAICSAPGTNSQIFSFLIKESPTNGHVTELKKGATVDISPPMGKGFQIEEYFRKYKNDFPTTNVYLMACGSGLAPIAAAIDSGKLGLKTTAYESLFETKATLFIGAKTPKHLPLSSKYPEWESKGVKIVPVISQVADPLSTDWAGRTGYIQDALREDKIKVPRNSGALLCGMRDMTDTVKEMMLEAGVFEGRILLNF